MTDYILLLLLFIGRENVSSVTVSDRFVTIRIKK